MSLFVGRKKIFLSSICLDFCVFGKSKNITIPDIIKDYGCILQAIPSIFFKNPRYYQIRFDQILVQLMTKIFH